MEEGGFYVKKARFGKSNITYVNAIKKKSKTQSIKMHRKLKQEKQGMYARPWKELGKGNRVLGGE